MKLYRSSEHSFQRACMEITRVIEETKAFHQDPRNSGFDALALEDALTLERQESGSLAHLVMQMESASLSRAKRIKGVILIGPRESGKHVVLDTCQHTFEDTHTMRMHFSDFMQTVFIPQLLAFRHNDTLPLRDPVPYCVHHLFHTQQIRMLVLEEFSMTNLGDALLMRRLFVGLMGFGTGVILTTSRPPNTWYRQGVHAKKVSSFQQFIKSSCELVRMDPSTPTLILGGK